MRLLRKTKRRQFLKREIEWVRRGALARTTKQKARLDRYEKIKEYGEKRAVPTKWILLH